MRTKKNHENRLNEILDVASKLFMEKGYEQTTINDILKALDMGKGTFYYYFKSKEEVMDSIIDKMVSQVVSMASVIADDSTLTFDEKFKKVIMSLNMSDTKEGGLIEEFHKPANALMHQKSIRQTITAIAPLLAKMVEEGVKEGVFHTEYPLETVEILLLSSHFIFDSDIFLWSKEEFANRAKAFASIVEKVLGTEKGSFDFLLEK